MFFRFGAAVALIVVVSLLGIALEKRALSLKRAISLQTYRAAQLEERRVQLRLRCEQLGAPARLLQSVESNSTAAREADSRS
ncbi:MAG: hypothetical protein U0992_16955 [Planctomycetaceae bacterium]